MADNRPTQQPAKPYSIPPWETDEQWMALDAEWEKQARDGHMVRCPVCRHGIKAIKTKYKRGSDEFWKAVLPKGAHCPYVWSQGRVADPRGRWPAVPAGPTEIHSLEGLEFQK